MPRTVSIPRHYGLDWLRIAAFGLLILYHIGMYFVPWAWHINRIDPAGWLAAPMLLLNSWRLPLLFVVSGYASAALLARQAHNPSIATQFLRERSTRLLIPVLVAIILIIPPQPWVELVTKSNYTGSLLHFWTTDYWQFSGKLGMILPTWQHLWFVCYLWAYTAALVLLLTIIPASIRARCQTIIDTALSGWRMIAVPALLAIVLVLARGVETVRLDAWVEGWAAHVIFFGSFLFGYYLLRADAGWAAIRRYWSAALVLSLTAYTAIIGVKFAFQGAEEPLWAVTAFAIARPLHGWCTIIALLGIADRFWNRDDPWRATLAEAVFPFYIIHQTIIVVTGFIIVNWMLPIPAEFAILLTATIVGCWLFYLIGKRFRMVRPLIGLKA